MNSRIEQDHRGIKGRYRPMRALAVRDPQRGRIEDTTSCVTSSDPAPVTTSTFPPIAADYAFSANHDNGDYLGSGLTEPRAGMAAKQCLLA